MKNAYNDLSYKELVMKRDELRRRHFDLRMKKVQGHLENPYELRTIRREVSQLNCIIHEYALGIREESNK